MSKRIPGTKFVRAGQLPRYFTIPTTYHKGGYAEAVRVGRKMRVSFLGQSVLLPLSARVRVVKASLPFVKLAA
jgi:hypothetical protein